MKSIFKILVLGVVPILAATAVVDQGLAADKGSQLIFQSNMAHQNYISVANANDGNAVTVLVQYYNDEMTVVLYYLRVIPGGGNVLVDPFDHEIPGTATNVSDVLDGLPAMTQTTGDELPGINSGRFLVVVTAVGAKVGVDHNKDDKIADVIAADQMSTTTGTTTTVAGYHIDRKDTLVKADDEIILIKKDTPATGDPTYTVLGNTAQDTQYVAESNRAETVNVLFPTFLAEDMHGIDNIDNGGILSLVGAGLSLTNKDEAKKEQADGSSMDESTKNVGDLTVSNAEPIAFNHLTGHFTEALTSTGAGGSDQTASWGGTPIVRPAVANTANGMVTFSNAAASDAMDRMVYMMGDYYPLNGKDPMPVVDHTDTATGPLGWLSLDDHNAIERTPAVGDTPAELITPLETAATLPDDTVATNFDNAAVVGFRGGRLAEKDAGGAEAANVVTKGGMRSGYKPPSKIKNEAVVNRGLNGGALVLPALHGGSGEETHQIMLFLSAADTFGGAGGYKLVKALTKYAVTVHDNMGNVLPNPADNRIFGGTGGPTLAGTSIIVEGIRVITDAAACGGKPSNIDENMVDESMLDGYWTLANLISDIPTASSGAKDFAGLDAMLDPMKNATPGFIKFKRAALKCTNEYGDGNNDDGDGVPATDNRTYEGGTLIVEQTNTDRAFVTTGQVLLKFLTPDATFAASWSLKSPPSSPAN